ncbi:MAG: hypothetical protein QXT45_02020 [Candidatus Bilamarchaeaceae archaeon]
MEFDELLITTGVDALVKLVKQKGKIEVDECAATLNIPSDTIEEWARVLEEEGIIRVEYKLAKIYLVWVQPAAEQIEEERLSFEKEKAELTKEIEKTKEALLPEMEKIEKLKESFSEVYARVYKRLDDIERNITPVIAEKELSEKRFDDSLKILSNAVSEINRIRNEIKELQKEVSTLSSQISKPESEKAFERFKTLQNEIFGLMSELKETKRKLKEEVPTGIEIPSAAEMRKKFDSLVRDFNEMKKRNAILREDIVSIKEGAEIVSAVGGSLKEYEKTSATLKQELKELTKEADKLFENIKRVDEKLKENFDTIERFSDSLEVAKGIVTRFPSQAKLHEEMKELERREREIEEKVSALKRLLEVAGGRRTTAVEAEELAKNIEDKLAELKEESLKISEALEEDKNRYVTFQQIKERIVPSLKGYNAEIDKIEKELERMRGIVAAQETEIKKEAKKFAEKVGESELKKALEAAKEIKEKKKLLDEINNSLSRLSEISDGLNKRLTLLSHQAKLLELRIGEGKVKEKEEIKEKEAYIKEQMRLTKEEEMEFLRKREELKKLIKKLWEESS